MKDIFFSRAVLPTAILALILAVPGRGVSGTIPLTLVSSWTASGGTQNEPSGITADAAMKLAADAGINMGSITQEGYALISGATTDVLATAPSWSMLDVSYALWDYGSTLSNTAYTDWSTIYDVGGNPGDSYDVTLNYTYENSRVNLTMDGRTESSSSLQYVWGALPGSNTTSAKNVASGYGFILWAYTLECAYGDQGACAFLSTWGSTTVSYDHNYDMVAVSVSDDTQTGSIDLGMFSAGDELFLMSTITSEADAEVYGPSVTLTTEFASAETDLSTTLEPAAPTTVPEPASITLFISGLAALAGRRCRKFVPSLAILGGRRRRGKQRR